MIAYKVAFYILDFSADLLYSYRKRRIYMENLKIFFSMLYIFYVIVMILFLIPFAFAGFVILMVLVMLMAVIVIIIDFFKKIYRFFTRGY